MKHTWLGLLLVAHVASAQALPDANALLERESTALDSYSTYRFEEASTMSMSVAGMPVTMDMTMVVAAASPGKRRIETRMSAMPGDAQVLVTNGKDSWLSVPMLNMYMRVPEGAAPPAGLVGGFPSTGQVGGSATVVRSEEVTVDGVPHDCWVVESSGGTLSLGVMELQNVRQTSWIDKALGVSLRRVMNARMKSDLIPGDMDMRVETAKRNLVFNEPMQDSLFVFTPPAGATEVDAASVLSGGSPLQLTTPPAAPSAPPPGKAPASKKSTGPDAASEPQAFVPLLNPVVEVEPVLPADAKERGLGGMIQLIVTIDAQGGVTNAEAITGPKELRAAAEDTVRQSRFQPVMRDGRPVAAYTTQYVDFTDWSRPRTVEVNVAEEMAAAGRLEALARQWPRSAQQELADLENDLEAAHPAFREAFLPRLAKAALTANATEKADRYANEVLGKSSSRPVADGDAVHDAHVILGLLALQDGRVDLARQHLHDAGAVSGGPQISSFGPDFSLAQRLLEAGERDAVLEYLASCGKFWRAGATRLDEWSAAIRAGGHPRLVNPLVTQMAVASAESRP